MTDVFSGGQTIREQIKRRNSYTDLHFKKAKMSRKFSDSEIRAYSKNRYEEKLLRRRLDKLKESAGVYHDATAKQRQDLVAECKDIRMTTGESQPPAGFEMDTNFDISKRVTRPWAYSAMETTYNAVYRDAIIPLPKQSRCRTGSRSGLLSRRSSMYSNRVTSAKSYSPSIKSAMTTRSDNTLHRLAPPNINRSVSNPEINTFNLASNRITITIDDTDATNNRGDETEPVPKDATMFSSDKGCKIVVDSNNSSQKTVNMNTYVEVETVSELREGRGRSNSFIPLKEHEVDTRIITLPPMYKIDSKAYQDAERERTISRSRSRVSFSSFVGVHESHDEHRQKSKSTAETKRPSSETKNTEQDKHGKANLDKENTVAEESNGENDRNAKHILTIDPETLVDAEVRKKDDVVYQGRRLRNYIKPEERYKLDPLVMKRRQNKMDKLAKESGSFLKRVNHENIRVEIAFPRSARKRIMTKLVQENNSGRSKTVVDNNEPVIQKKIEYFMNSMSDYIHQQQLEREQYFQ